MYLLLRADRTRQPRALAFAGALAPISYAVQDIGAPVAVVLVAYLSCGTPGRSAPRSAYLAGAATPLGVCAVDVRSRRAPGARFFYANVTYNRLYGGHDNLQRAPALALMTMPSNVFVGGLGFWLLASAGTLVHRDGTSRRNDDLLLLLWALGCYAGIKATGRESAHYYVQLLPVGALLGARAARRSPPCCRRRSQALAVLSATALVGFQIAVYASQFATPAARAEVHSLYPWMYACESRAPEIGAWVAAIRRLRPYLQLGPRQ